jgi:hypothetical protein
MLNYLGVWYLNGATPMVVFASESEFRKHGPNELVRLIFEPRLIPAF